MVPMKKTKMAAIIGKQVFRVAVKLRRNITSLQNNVRWLSLVPVSSCHSHTYEGSSYQRVAATNLARYSTVSNEPPKESYESAPASAETSTESRQGPVSIKAETSTESSQSLPSVAETSTNLCSADDEAIPGPSAELMASLSAEQQKKLHILWMEVEVAKQSGFETPKLMSDDNWQDLLALESYMGRRKFCRYLFLTEIRKKRDQKMKEERRIIAQQKYVESLEKEPGLLDYGLHRNTIFYKFHETNMNLVYNFWSCQAIMFGSKLVFDLGYDEHMRKMDAMNCAEQLQMAYGYNKSSRDQFHLIFCNVKEDGETYTRLHRMIPNLDSHNCLVTTTSQSYLDLFPKKDIVYLTPNCSELLDKFDPDDVYIIGAIVDKSIQKPVTLAKAKKEGLRMAKLPLDKYLMWGSSHKSLTLDQMVKIMLDIKNTGDWNTALKHVPQRKLKTLEELQAETLRSKIGMRKKKFLFQNDDEDMLKFNFTKK